MSKVSERYMLRDHGTRAFEMKPGTIISTALSDLRLRERKLADEVDGALPYAFHRDHVKKATGPGDLIARALKDIGKGAGSTKFNTALIYSDEALLQRALDEVAARAAAPEPQS